MKMGGNDASLTELCCGCVAEDAASEYDLGLHIAAVFIIFAVSISGTLVPIVSSRGPFATQQATIALEWLTAFGFGVVIATAFIHMVGEGIHKLSDPCLGPIVEEYESIGLVIVLTTVLLMHLIECESAVFMSVHGRSGGHAHGHTQAPAARRSMAASSVGQSFFAITPVATEAQFNSLHQAKPSIVGAVVSEIPKPTKAPARKLAAALFEMGVLFHSMVVGLDLGVTSGTEFSTLLTAMCVHQFFEGVALGGSTLGAMENLQQVLLMDTGFAVTTPLGLVLGITIRSSYSETSTTALWMQGILNCLAGGILLYTGHVELLTYQITTNGEFLARSGYQRAVLYAAIWFGAGTMALIGKWA